MKTFAVIGLGGFGAKLARQLTQAGAQVIAIDQRRPRVQELRDDVDRAVCLDATDEDALKSQGVDRVDCAVVGIGTAFEAAILATVALKQIGVPRVISRATTETRAEILAKVGADQIVNPESEAADRWRNQLLAPDMFESIMCAGGYSLVQSAAPGWIVGKTLGDAHVRAKYYVQVVAIRRTAEDTDADGVIRTREIVLSAPGADAVIQKDDAMVLIGTDAAIQKFVQS